MKINRGAVAIAKQALFNAQNGLCSICFKPLRQGWARGSHTFDHVWPRRFRRPNVEHWHGNVLLAHSKCNGGKSDTRPSGCQLLMLFAVNRALGMPEHATVVWDTPRNGCFDPRGTLAP